MNSTPAISNAPTNRPKGLDALRDQLTAEVEAIKSSDEAANWAHRVLKAKNTLTTADAERVEKVYKAFEAAITADYDAQSAV
jgi:hypothetical protein